MTAVYLIPIVSLVIVSSSGGLIATVLPDPQDRLRTLIVSFVFWGIATPLSWIIITLYFLRLTIHKPLSREVIVSALLPIGPPSLSAFA
jgi:tellurite resistance protein TehA-like permease